MLNGRLVALRDFRREDVATLYELDTDPEFVSLTDERPFQPRPLSAHLADFDRRQSEPDPKVAVFAIQHVEDQRAAALGRVLLWNIDLHQRSAHIGISLLPSARGKGFGRDALEVICRFGFEIRGLERLSLETLEVNAAMRRTATVCGFTEEGRLRKAAWHLGRRVDEMVYGILADEWRARQD